MGFPVIQGFNISGTDPIDLRLVVADITARDNLNASFRYEGMTVFVQNRGDGNPAVYQLRSGTANSNWVGISADADYITASPSSGSLTLNLYNIADAKKWITASADFSLNFSNFQVGSQVIMLLDPSSTVTVTFPSSSITVNGQGNVLTFDANTLNVIGVINDGTNYRIATGINYG